MPEGTFQLQTGISNPRPPIAIGQKSQGLFCEKALGSSEVQATHILIADREQGQVYVAPIWTGTQFLREQWPPPEPLTTRAADIVIEALRQAMSEMGTPDLGEIERVMQEAQERLKALQRALYPDLSPLF